MNSRRKDDEDFLINVYTRMPFSLEKAEGHYLIDEKDNRFLDLFCGVGVTALGHRHPKILQAIEKQLNAYMHISNNFINPYATDYAKDLVGYTFGKGKVFFGNSGTEASESAIKLVHKWSRQKNEENRGILVLTDSYHGRTLGAMQLTRQAHVYQDFPVTKMPFFEINRNDIQSLIETVETHRPHAIMIETVLGAGGVYPLEDRFMDAIQEVCEKHDILLIVDEVQTGFGRTGTFFSYEQTNLKPDVVIFGKACGGGLPLSGIIANERTSELFQHGDHGTTFGPNPVSIAAGHALFKELFESQCMTNAIEISDYLYSELLELQQTYPTLIQDIRHKGMMFGIELGVTPKETRSIQHDLIEKGILVDVTRKTVIRLLPPLTLTYLEAKHFIDMLALSLSSLVVKQKQAN